jgi:signal transduction histidine kinase
MQLAFWTASIIVLDFFRAASGELHGLPDLVVPSLVWIGVGHGISSVLIRVGMWLRVDERRLPVITACAIVGVVAATLATTAALLAISVLLGAVLQPGDAIGLAVIVAIVFTVWSAAALSVAQTRRAHHAERRLLVAESVAAKARLRMLRHQLNPHFLFNALNSLAATIDEDRDRAQRLVLDLSSLLRDVLADDIDDGTLGDELDRIERYVRIERARFEDRLQLRASVADQLRTTSCLPWLLQPLIENAIKHGASGARAEVELAVTLEDGRVQIRISNPISKASVAGAGVGLANVRERLVVRYGSAHRREHRQRPDGWMDVELSWPYESTP